MKFEEKIKSVLNEDGNPKTSIEIIKNNAENKPGDQVIDENGDVQENSEILSIDKYRIKSITKDKFFYTLSTVSSLAPFESQVRLTADEFKRLKKSKI